MNLLWQEHAPHFESLIRNWKEESQVPPVILISGPSGIGKRDCAWELAQRFLCLRLQGEESNTLSLFGDTPVDTQHSGSNEPCGECSSCQRNQGGNAVDFLEVSPENKDGRRGKIKIDAFREVIAKQGFGAHEGRHKVVLVSDAEQMTIQAANSLLKILEEPPSGWIFILTACHVSLLLPTLVSRCHRLRLRPLGESTVKKLLEENEKDLNPGQIQIAAKISQGSFSKARQMLLEENWEKRSTLFRFLEQPQSEFSSLVDWAASESSHMEMLLDQLDLITYDLVQWSQQNAQAASYPWMNQDGKAALTRHAQRMSQSRGSIEAARQQWLDLFQHHAEVRSKLGAPLAKKLMAQDLLAPWLNVAD